MEWMILIHLSELIINDASIEETILQNDLKKFLETNFGLQIDDEKIIEKTRKQEFKGKLGMISGGIGHEIKKTRGNYLDYLNDLRNTVLELLGSSNCKYSIYYDDLDDKFSLSDLYMESTLSLINATKKINRLFSEQSINAKVILVLRTDVF